MRLNQCDCPSCQPYEIRTRHDFSAWVTFALFTIGGAVWAGWLVMKFVAWIAGVMGVRG